MGSSTAYWLKCRDPNLSVAVVERDMTYARASTGLSVGSIRQQFSIEGNVRMSLFGSLFIQNIHDHLSINNVDDDPTETDVGFVSSSYLFLATEQGVPILKENHTLQTSLGAKVKYCEPEEIADMYPWLNVEDVAAGCVGTENEGWFDPWSLLNCFRKKASSIGVEYILGEVVDVGVDSESQIVTHVDIAESNSSETTRVQCGFAVNAGGPWASSIHRMACQDSPGTLPIHPRKRNVFVVHAPTGPHETCPMIIDPSGVYCRREGSAGHFLCGKSPDAADDPDTDNLDVDYGFFDEHIWEVLAHRVPAFENLKCVNAWAGFYEYNTVDQNAIIGRHPSIANFLMICGFSGHGIQQSPAAGRAVSELIIDGDFQTIDLSAFGYDRIVEGRPLLERNII